MRPVLAQARPREARLYDCGLLPSEDAPRTQGTSCLSTVNHTLCSDFILAINKITGCKYANACLTWCELQQQPVREAETHRSGDGSFTAGPVGRNACTKKNDFFLFLQMYLLIYLSK